jgi:hypothetical protein
MSMGARLGRFLEIYGPKFWDFQWKSDFGWKSSDYETQLMKSNRFGGTYQEENVLGGHLERKWIAQLRSAQIL